MEITQELKQSFIDVLKDYDPTVVMCLWLDGGTPLTAADLIEGLKHDDPRSVAFISDVMEVSINLLSRRANRPTFKIVKPEGAGDTCLMYGDQQVALLSHHAGQHFQTLIDGGSNNHKITLDPDGGLMDGCIYQDNVPKEFRTPLANFLKDKQS